ncbi:MAG: hypothetical protein ABGY72_15460 [bacterium]
MPLFLPEERPIAEALAGLTYANPFQSEFLARQRDVLDPDHASEVAVSEDRRLRRCSELRGGASIRWTEGQRSAVRARTA